MQPMGLNLSTPVLNVMGSYKLPFGFFKLVLHSLLGELVKLVSNLSGLAIIKILNLYTIYHCITSFRYLSTPCNALLLVTIISYKVL